MWTIVWISLFIMLGKQGNKKTPTFKIESWGQTKKLSQRPPAFPRRWLLGSRILAGLLALPLLCSSSHPRLADSDALNRGVGLQQCRPGITVAGQLPSLTEFPFHRRF